MQTAVFQPEKSFEVLEQLTGHAEAILHLRKAFAIAEKEGDLRTMAVVSGNMGNTFSDQGEHSVAIDYFTTCLEMADKQGIKVVVPSQRQVSKKEVGEFDKSV